MFAISRRIEVDPDGIKVNAGPGVRGRPHQSESPRPPMDIRQRGVQWMGVAVDGGHKWSNKQNTHTDNCQA